MDDLPTLDELHIGMELDEDNITYEADGTAVWWGIRHRCPEGTPCRDDAERALATRHFGGQSDA